MFDSYCSLQPLWSGMGKVVLVPHQPYIPIPSHCAVIILLKKSPKASILLTRGHDAPVFSLESLRHPSVITLRS